MRSRADRLSRALVRRYPRAWRERYADEMLALIDDTGSTWRHALDLTIGCADAWLRTILHLAFFRNWLGALLVPVVSEMARYFSLVLPDPVRIAFAEEFGLLALFLFGSTFFTFAVAMTVLFRRACIRWFDVILARPTTVLTPAPESVRPDPSAPLGQVRMFTVVILILATGASLTKSDLIDIYGIHFSRTMVFWMTFAMLQQINLCVYSLRSARILWLWAAVRKRDPHAE